MDWIGRWQTVQSIVTFLKPTFGPFVVAALAAITGIAGHEPWMWIIMATSLTFMATIAAMLFAKYYSFMRSPAHKLRYMGTTYTQDLHPLNRQGRRTSDTTGRIVKRTIDKSQVGVQLHNSAHFPISAILVEADTEMDGNRPPRATFPKKPVTIFPGNVIMMMDDAIPMNQTPCERLEGRLYIKIKYGLQGNENNELIFKAKLEVLIREDGFVHGTYTHWDPQQSSV